ncbi:MAG: hypothetical protein ACE5GN_04435, partial [Waddliaceae bacterium]
GLVLLKGAFYSKINNSILPEMAAMLVKEYRKQRATYQEAKDSLQKAISEKMGSPESDPEVARIFSLIENGTGFAAKQLRQKLQESLQSDALNLTTEFIGEDKQKNRQLDAANRLLKGLASAKSELPHDITDLLDEQIEALLMKMMANLLQNPEFSKESLTKGAGVSDLIIRFLGAMTDKLAQLKEQETDGDDLNAFVPLAQELLKMANPTLPSLFGMNKRLWKQMENRVLPGFLAKMYKETSSWVRRKEKNQKKLQELFGTTHAQEACRVLSHYIADFLPWYLSTSNDQIAEMAFTLMSNQTKKADDPQSQAFLQEIKKNKQVIMDFVSHHAQKLGDSNSDEAKKVWGLAKEYGEAALLEMFVRMAKRVHSLESTKGKNYRPEFAMHTAFQLLEKLREHFGKTNEIKDNQGVKHAHQVDPETMYAEFGETLHSGIPAASDLPEEEKQRTRLDDFSGFIDKIQNILQLSGNTQALGKQIFPNLLLRLMNHLNEDYTKDSMLLGVLQMINEALQEPPKDDPKLSRHHEEEKKKDFSGALSSIVSNELANLDTESKTKATLTITDWLMHLEDKESTLTLEEHLEELGCQLEDIVPEQNLREKRKNLSKPLCEFTLYWNELQKNNSLSFQEKQALLKKKREALIQTSTEEMTRPLEALQILLQERKFDAECGEMVRELINMLPFTMTKTIFNDFDILKEKSAETVGRLVRSYFDRTSMLEIIDKGIVRILPYLHPGEWKGEEGQETFEPQGGKYKFDLPKTPEEKAALKAKRKRQAKRKRREFAKTAAETLSSQLANGLTKFIKSLWDGFTGTFGSTFPSAKKFFDRVFNHGISQFIMSGFKMLFKTLLEIGRSLFEETYLKRKMRKVTKTAHMPHHENLFYQWRDVLVDALDVTSEQPAKA